MEPNQKHMDEITLGLPSKSEKIRRLSAAGYSRRQIADFIGVRYQFVRNVVVDEERKQKGEAGEMAEPRPAWRAEEPRTDAAGKIRVRADGAAVIPTEVLAKAGFKAEDAIVVHVSGDGEIHLLSRLAAVRRAQALIRPFVPKGVSLVDELIKERRREAEKENG